MTDTAWTWLLFLMEVIGVTGMFFIGKMKWWGWGIVLAHSIPWFVYSITHDKPGFIAMSLMWWCTHFYNMQKWRKQKHLS